MKDLKQILVDNPHEHPLIYLNGVRESELQSLLQLMYKGETKYKKGQREPFLKLIQHLEMPGLIFPRETNLFINKSIKNSTDMILNTEKLKQEPFTYENESDLKGKTNGLLIPHDKILNGEGVNFECDRCDYKTTRWDSLQRHHKSIHEYVRYECNLCEYKATRRYRIKAHWESEHEGISHEWQ